MTLVSARGAMARGGQLASFLVLLVLLGCAADSPADSPSGDEPAGLQVTIDHETLRLRIDYAAGDPKLLAEVALPELRFRTADATFEMLFGMFRIEEVPLGPWVSPAGIGPLEPQGADGFSVTLLDADEAPLGRLDVSGGADGHVRVAVGSLDPAHNRARLALDCRPDDHFAGLGAQTHDVDHRGQLVPLFVSEQGIGKSDDNEYQPLWFVEGRRHTTYMPIPAVVTSRGSAWAVDTTAYSEFDLCKTDPARTTIEVWEGHLALHLFAGPTPLQALERMTEWTGRPDLPPPWTFAPWNDATHGTEAVREFARFLRANEIPSSVIWSEDWRGGKQLAEGYRLTTDWWLDRELYPDFEGFLSDLEEDGFVFQAYFNTFVYEDSDVYEEAIAEGHCVMRATDPDAEGGGELVPWRFQGPAGGFPFACLADLTRPETRDWVRGFLVRALELGIRGWMADYGEWLPIDDAVLASGEDPALVHNIYPLLWQEINREAVREAGLENEVAIFFRSGFLGSQPLAGILWAGDQRTSFDADDGLPTIIPIGLGLSATGFPFHGHDVAGYQSVGNPPVSKELFFRWTELAAFTPVMRTHHGIAVDENWTLASDQETTELWRRYASLHVRLYPYLRALALRAVAEGRPLWIPLGLLHPRESELWPLMDQFYLGEALLVAPVVHEGVVARDVLLPTRRFVRISLEEQVLPRLGDGALDSDEGALNGPATVRSAAPLGEVPVFIGAGGIVPMTVSPAMTLLPGREGLPGIESTEEDRVLHVGLGADGALTEESGARYLLFGSGTDAATGALVGGARESAKVQPTAGSGAVAAFELQGDGVIEGDGFRLVLEGHPAERRTRVLLY